MSSEKRRAERSSPTDDPHLRPLVSTADVPRRLQPTTQIPSTQLDVLEQHGKRRARNGARGSEGNHVMGILGEVAAARYLGVEDRVDTNLYENGDGGVDFSYRGVTIDVKTVGRHRSDPALTVDAYQELRADYYVLVDRIGQNEYRLVGYAPRHFVANAAQMRHGGDYFHIVPQEDLFPFPQWI